MTSVLTETQPDWSSLPAADPTVRGRVSEEEWATRVDLAAC